MAEEDDFEPYHDFNDAGLIFDSVEKDIMNALLSLDEGQQLPKDDENRNEETKREQQMLEERRLKFGLIPAVGDACTPCDAVPEKEPENLEELMELLTTGLSQEELTEFMNSLETTADDNQLLLPGITMEGNKSDSLSSTLSSPLDENNSGDPFGFLTSLATRRGGVCTVSDDSPQDADAAIPPTITRGKPDNMILSRKPTVESTATESSVSNNGPQSTRVEPDDVGTSLQKSTLVASTATESSLADDDPFGLKFSVAKRRYGKCTVATTSLESTLVPENTKTYSTVPTLHFSKNENEAPTILSPPSSEQHHKEEDGNIEEYLYWPLPRRKPTKGYPRGKKLVRNRTVTSAA